MAKEKFERLLYLGPVSAFSIVTPAPAGSEAEPVSESRSLVTGETYDDLPPDHPVIANLVAHKLLVTPPKTETPEASPDRAVAESETAKSGGDRSAERKPKSEG